MRPTEAVEDHVDAVLREPPNLLDEILMLVIDRDPAKLGNRRRRSR
jgi:hypothetical protein